MKRIVSAVLLFAVVSVLAGCKSPQERAMDDFNRQMRAMERLMADMEKSMQEFERDIN